MFSITGYFLASTYAFRLVSTNQEHQVFGSFSVDSSTLAGLTFSSFFFEHELRSQIFVLLLLFTEISRPGIWTPETGDWRSSRTSSRRCGWSRCMPGKRPTSREYNESERRKLSNSSGWTYSTACLIPSSVRRVLWLVLRNRIWITIDWFDPFRYRVQDTKTWKDSLEKVSSCYIMANWRQRQ